MVQTPGGSRLAGVAFLLLYLQFYWCGLTIPGCPQAFSRKDFRQFLAAVTASFKRLSGEAGNRSWDRAGIAGLIQ